jgi:hypothetical protein
MADWGRRFVTGELVIDPESAPTAEGKAALQRLAEKQRKLITDEWMPQLSAKLTHPDLHDPFEWALCLTDEEIVALPATRSLAQFLDEE